MKFLIVILFFVGISYPSHSSRLFRENLERAEKIANIGNYKTYVYNQAMTDEIIKLTGNGVYLERADLAGETLDKAYLRRAFLYQAILRQTNLSSAILTGAYVAEADLFEAKLSGANLSGVSLVRAYLVGADMREADLREAILWGANLSGADMSGALADRANFSGALYDDRTRFPDIVGHRFDPEKAGMIKNVPCSSLLSQ